MSGPENLVNKIQYFKIKYMSLKTVETFVTVTPSHATFSKRGGLQFSGTLSSFFNKIYVG